MPSPKSNAYEIIVPSVSDDPHPCTEHVNVSQDPARTAVGDSLGMSTWKSSNWAATGALVAVEPRYCIRPTPPAVCSDAVESVALSNHAPGSAVPAGHTFTRVVVGWVPVVWNRTIKTVPGEYVTSGGMASGVSNTSLPFDAARPIDTPTAPVDTNRSLAR